VAKERVFTSEADLVAAFCDSIDPSKWARNQDAAPKWTAYHETAGWDLLLVHNETGEQIGIEAKLTLNAKVLEQALPSRWDVEGPDHRAVLVPSDGLQHHLTRIAHHLGIVVLVCHSYRPGSRSGPTWAHSFRPYLPQDGWSEDWPNWCPPQRCKLPDYVPDVTGGHAAPIKLSEWKIKAIKLLIRWTSKAS